MLMPIMVPVSSSNLSAVGYDGLNRQLYVTFTNGTIYRYLGVPAAVHAGLMAAGSHGQYLNYFIRSFYPAERLQ